MFINKALTEETTFAARMSHACAKRWAYPSVRLPTALRLPGLKLKKTVCSASKPDTVSLRILN